MENNEDKEEKTFDPNTMTEEMKAYVADQIALAVKTTRESAISDPDIIESVKASLKKEADKTAEERVLEKLAELNKKEATLEARNVFTKGGVPEELIETYINLSLSDDVDKTVQKANSLVEAYTSAFNKGKDTGLQSQKQNLSPPPIDSSKGKNKSFKDMTMEERMELKKNNPAKFEEEFNRLQYRF